MNIRTDPEPARNHSAAAAPRTRERRLARIQAISGLVFLGFVAVHLGNTMLAAHSGGIDLSRHPEALSER